MDAGGRYNPVVWTEDDAIVMVAYGNSYDVVTVTLLEDMEESMFAETDLLDRHGTTVFSIMNRLNRCSATWPGTPPPPAISTSRTSSSKA